MRHDLGGVDSRFYDGVFEPRSGLVGTGSTASRLNNAVRKDLRTFSCSDYGTLHTVLLLRQTLATDRRLLDMDDVGLCLGLDTRCSDARMNMQLAP
jgi:hypothetical protein